MHVIFSSDDIRLQLPEKEVEVRLLFTVTHVTIVES